MTDGAVLASVAGAWCCEAQANGQARWKVSEG